MFAVKDFLQGGKAAQILKELSDGKDVSVLSAHFGQKTAIASLLPEFVYVCSDYVTARETFEQISLMREAVYLPALDDVLTYARIRSGENYLERIKALYKISSGAKVVVTYVAALMQLFPEVEMFRSLCLTLKKGQEFDFMSLPPLLVKAGYKRVTHIDAPGQFAVRGDILDVSPVIYGNGVRIEFFGDEVDSIKHFDYYTQLSLDSMDEVEICPNTFITSAPADLSGVKGDTTTLIDDLRIKLESGSNDLSLMFIAPLLPHSTFSEFVKLKYIVYDDAKQISDNAAMTLREHNSRLKSLALQGAPFVEGQIVEDLSYDGVKLAFQSISNANRLFTPQAVITLDTFSPLTYRKNYEQFAIDVKDWMFEGYTVAICCGDDKLKDNIYDILLEKGALGKNIHLLTDKLEKGFVFHDIKLAVIGTYDLISKKAGVKKLSRSKKDVFTMPQAGEYVVHNVHGIGVMESITKMTMGGSTRDYCIIRYRDGDKLYVPVENIDCLSKYVAGGEEPRLNKIGGVDFAKVKDKVKASVKEMAFSLLKLYAERSEAKGFKYSDDNTMLEEFEAAFPYIPTDDQAIAVSECISDLTNGKIMDRLLCGDVGYGKTEVALRVAYKVISEGKQVAFISPTTILAKQHYKTASSRMAPFGVNICSLTRMDDPKEIKRGLAALSEGKMDLAVGTHRLLSSDVKFKDLGLLILDEEQRFGVADKEKLKLLKNNVNVLTLSATPIPRTLHMSMTGIRDMSILSAPPADRIPVQTYVTEYTDSLVYDAVMRELGRDGQVFIVYNRVESIDAFAGKMQALLGDNVRISVGHGQMKEDVLEKTINSFIAGESDVLIASTIIENGIDMPRANTMIVIDSDRLGLSQLYQLRGRIGRSNRLAYVFFTYGDKILSETAYKRLEAITQFTEFGSGFKIAMRDLEIRGAGNILGKAQHGHLEKVGYDMYCKILKEAVDELKGMSVAQSGEVKVAIDFEAFLPEGYITDDERRIDFYSKISTLSTMDEAKKTYSELRDIYGEVPKSVSNLMATALIKNLGSYAGATKVVFKKSEAGVYFDKIKDINKNVYLRAQGADCVFVPSPPSISFKGVGAQKKLINFLINCSSLPLNS
ncbi:MAG: transcription-repair coupling factor [Clostridiales bacterium]|nr:transcription-repair coupling factor [Clostridiales bacterium]